MFSCVLATRIPSYLIIQKILCNPNSAFVHLSSHIVVRTNFVQRSQNIEIHATHIEIGLVSPSCICSVYCARIMYEVCVITGECILKRMILPMPDGTNFQRVRAEVKWKKQKKNSEQKRASNCGKCTKS